MSIGTMEKDKQVKEWWISIANLSENDKWALLKYVSGENYMTPWEIHTDSIDNPKGFFEKLNALSNREKQNLLDELETYSKNKERVNTDPEWLQELTNEKKTQENIQTNEVNKLKNKINENNNEEVNTEQLKVYWREITRIINEITCLGIQGIWTTEEDKNKQIEWFLKQIEEKTISNEHKEKIKQFIQKSINKMYVIKNTYLEWWDISPEKVQNLLCDIMGIIDEQAKNELSRFVKESWLQLQVELKWPSLVFHIPRKIKKILWYKIVNSAYWFAIVETQWKINDKEMYKKIAKKYLSFGGIKCTDSQIHVEDLKGSVIIINAGKGQFTSTEKVEEHEYKHILNAWYLMQKKWNVSDTWIRLAQWYLIPIDTAIDELLAGMGIESLTNELWFYNFYLEEIKNKEYDQTTPIIEVLENLKKDPQKYEEYKTKRETHKEKITTYYNYFTNIIKNTGLDKKTTANMLAGEPIEKRKELAEKQ